MKQTRSILLAFIATAPFASAATSLINVDFNVTNSSGNIPSPVTMTGGDVLGTTGDTWTAVTVARNNSIGNVTSVPTTGLNYSDGSLSGITLNITTFNNAIITDHGSSIAANQQPLMNDYIYLNGTQSSTITLSGFAANQQIDSIVLYGQAINSFGTTSGSTFTISGFAPRSTSETATSIGSTLVEDVDYVRFNGLTADASGKLLITWSNVAGQGAFNGMQIQVPEPSVVLFGGLGALGLLRRRRN